MNTAVLSKIYGHLEESGLLQWIEEDCGQLNSTQRPSIALPAALIDISYTDCVNMTKRNQRVKINVQLKIALSTTIRINTSTPKEAQDASFKRIRLVSDIHSLLQGWDGDGLFMPMARKKESSEIRADGVKVYTVIYQMDSLDII